MPSVRGIPPARAYFDWRGGAALPAGVVALVVIALFLTYANGAITSLYADAESVPVWFSALFEVVLAALLLGGAHLIPAVAGRPTPWRVFTYLIFSILLVLAYYATVTIGAVTGYVLILNVFLQQRRKLRGMKPKKPVVFPTEDDENE